MTPNFEKLYKETLADLVIAQSKLNAVDTEQTYMTVFFELNAIRRVLEEKVAEAKAKNVPEEKLQLNERIVKAIKIMMMLYGKYYQERDMYRAKCHKIEQESLDMGMQILNMKTEIKKLEDTIKAEIGE